MSTRMLILTLLFLTACARGPLQPVEIEPADRCDLCKMAISQKQFAAELIDAEQRVFKFDDIGCMLKFARERSLIGAAPGATHVFFVDYDTRDWLKSDSAQFVQSPRIPSPMASGLMAVSKSETAQKYAAKFSGKALGFAEIWKQE